MAGALQIPTGFDYVLILEWLKADDRPTGTELYRFLNAVRLRAELEVCRSWNDIQLAMRTALLNAPARGIPAIHLETHGADPWQTRPEDIGFGPTADESVPWSSLHLPLSRLNVVSDFRALFVSAACWGSGAMAAFSGEGAPAPFAAAVGFRTSIGDGNLMDAMKELYRSIVRGSSIQESVESAQRELVKGQELKLEIGVEIAAKILLNSYCRPPIHLALRAPEIRLRNARNCWNVWYPTWLQTQVPAYEFPIKHADEVRL
jgi:hypothetical protein